MTLASGDDCNGRKEAAERRAVLDLAERRLAEQSTLQIKLPQVREWNLRPENNAVRHESTGAATSETG
eukprot:697616-Rhodomonas_salina.1